MRKTRSGVGTLDLIDDDQVCLTSINRQIFAARRTVGQCKVDVAEQRILEINPNAIVHKHCTFYTPQTASQFFFSQYDYVVDAIDTVTGKLELVQQAEKASVPIISSMGAGNKLDPTAFEVADIYDTSVCPLARVMRQELRRRGIGRLKVVYSKEPPLTPIDDTTIICRTHCICPPGTARKCTQRRQVPGSNAFVPAVAGLIIAGEVIKDLTGVWASFMEKIRKYGFLLIMAALMLCLSGCSSNENGSSGAASLAQNTAASMVIPMDELTAEPRFYDWNQNGTAMQLIALKSSTGDVQLAYNTCQSCAGSPYAYFEYQNGVLVCQNCMNRFGLDSVGKVAGGCNPMPVTGYQLDGDQVTIPADALTKAASSFRNWKVFR